MRKYISLLFVALLLLVLVACQAEDSENETEEAESNDTITVEHELGTAEIKKNPENVVVFDFGMLDTLDYLNIDVKAIPKMNIPSYLDQYNSDDYENIGSLKEPDFEKINEINPDLIIISGRQADLYDELEELAPVLYVGLDYDNYIESFTHNLEIVGEIFEKEEEINEVLDEINDEIASIQELVADEEKEALILLANDNEISAYGENSRFGLIHDVFGIHAVDPDIEESTHGMSVTFEYVLEQNPDILYVIDRGSAIGEEATAKQVVENELISKTTAYENGDIYYLDPEIWYLSGGGIVSMQKMIDEIKVSFE